MYEAYFNLRVKPFELVPDPEFIFMSRVHKKALTYLDYGITEKAGFILLTGDVGSGKTTLLRNLLKNHDEKIILAKIFNTSVNSEQLLAMINDDFGISTKGKDKIALLRDLNEFLVQQFASGKQPVLIIDEAQNLSQDLLEEVRMLSNLETANSKLLQIILAGQPELRTLLSSPELLQLRQRISINCNLSALSRFETEQYIKHRLLVAGNASAVEFETETFDIVYRFSRGIPRLINIICDFLMLAAFAEETKIVTAEMTREVIGDMDFENHFWAVNSPDGIPVAPPTTQNIVPTPQKEVQEMLSAILHRVESIESDVHKYSNHTANDDQIAMLQKTIDGNRAYTEMQLHGLSNKIDSLVKRSKAEIPKMRTPEKSNVGFFRTLLGHGNTTKG